jgi:FkbM family methyltransferase
LKASSVLRQARLVLISVAAQPGCCAESYPDAILATRQCRHPAGARRSDSRRSLGSQCCRKASIRSNRRVAKSGSRGESVLTSAMSHLRAMARRRAYMQRAIDALDRLRHPEAYAVRRTLGGLRMAWQNLAASPHLRQSRIVVDTEGSWLATPSGIFVLNESTWGLLMSPFEERERAIIAARLSTAGHFVDVGANFGFHSIAAARAVPDATVHAFEPVPTTVELLEKNVAKNALGNVKTYPLAVAARRGEVEMTAEFGTGNHILKIGAALITPRTVKVVSITLDEFWSQSRECRIDIVKIDVEGAEVGVLRGGERMFRTLRPDVLVELSPQWLERYGNTRSECVAILRGYGYRNVEAIDAESEQVSIDTFDAGAARANNFLFRA